MKIASVSITNIGLIADASLDLNKPLILLYGDIRQGKSTVLNAVRLAFGGAFPADILSHGALEGSVKLTTTDGYLILREFYRGEDGSTKARPLTVQRHGVRVPKPVEFLKKFLNPFLLDGDYLANMPADERKKYFVSLFAVNTDDLDLESGKCEVEAKELRAKVKAYGSINLTKVEPVDVDSLKLRLNAIRERNDSERKQVAEAVEKQKRQNSDFDRVNGETIRADVRYNELSAELRRIQAEMAKVQEDRYRNVEWLRVNPRQEGVFEAEIEDTYSLEEEISNAKANNILAAQYEANLLKAAQRLVEESRISQLEQAQRDISKEKAARLKQLSDDCGIEGLEFLDGGDFIFESTSSAMLSTSQIMKLSTLLSGMYPDGVGLDLLDRAESLGKSIFDYVQKAKDGNKTILATIVGERPANIPAEVGVFVVEKGKLS